MKVSKAIISGATIDLLSVLYSVTGVIYRAGEEKTLPRHSYLRCRSWQSPLIVICIDRDKISPVVGHLVIHEDGFYRAFRLTQATIDAFRSIYVKLWVAVVAVDAVHRAHSSTGFILDANAGFRNNVRHADFTFQEGPTGRQTWNQSLKTSNSRFANVRFN